MQLPSLNHDLWRLMTLEDCTSGIDAVMPGTPNLQRSPAAIPHALDLQTLQRGDGAKLRCWSISRCDRDSPRKCGRLFGLLG